MLTSRFGILRKALPWNYGIAKIGGLVKCLCSLHNFLVDNNDSTGPNALAYDAFDLSMDGAFAIAAGTRSELGREVVQIPDPLLHGGQHSDDHQRPRRAPLENRRSYLHSLIVEEDYRRPV
jgi:hypothetical protein